MSILYPVEFWCSDCKILFSAEVFESDPEVVTCLKCKRECLSLDAELDEAEKLMTENRTIGAITGLSFGGPLLAALRASSADQNAPEVHDLFTDRIRYRVVSRKTAEAEANSCVDELFEYGLLAELAEPKVNSRRETIFEVFVPNRDAPRARKVLSR